MGFGKKRIVVTRVEVRLVAEKIGGIVVGGLNEEVVVIVTEEMTQQALSRKGKFLIDFMIDETLHGNGHARQQKYEVVQRTASYTSDATAI
jgi:hypothetical protein